MRSQILSILIDFIQDPRILRTIFGSFYKSLDTNNSGTGNDIKEQ